GTVVCELAAAPRPVDGEHAGILQVLEAGAGAGRIEWRMLEQPGELGRTASGDGRRTTVHLLDSLLVADRPIADPPFDDGGKPVPLSARTPRVVPRRLRSRASRVGCTTP